MCCYVFPQQVVTFPSITVNILSPINRCLRVGGVSVGFLLCTQSAWGKWPVKAAWLTPLYHCSPAETHSHTHTHPFSRSFSTIPNEFPPPLIIAAHRHLSSLEGLVRQLVLLRRGERLVPATFCSLHGVPHQQVDNQPPPTALHSSPSPCSPSLSAQSGSHSHKWALIHKEKQRSCSPLDRQASLS